MAMRRTAGRLTPVLLVFLLAIQPLAGAAGSTLETDDARTRQTTDRLPTAEGLRERIPDLETTWEGHAGSTLAVPDAFVRTLDELRLTDPTGLPRLPAAPGPLPADDPAPGPSSARAVEDRGSPRADLGASSTSSAEEHLPIVIVGDHGPTGFELAPGVPRPGSGVRSGSGTAEDPYVISGWNVSGIRIQSTDAHVRIEANTIHPPPEIVGEDPLLELPPPFEGLVDAAEDAIVALEQDAAVQLEDADNVTLAGNDLAGKDGRVRAESSDHLRLEANTFEDPDDAIDVRSSREVHVRGHVFDGLGDDDRPTVVSVDVDEIAIEANRFTGRGLNLALLDGEQARLADNRFNVSGVAAVANGTTHVDVEANTFEGPFRHWDVGIGYAHIGEGTSQLRGNHVRDLVAGAIVQDQARLDLDQNTIEHGFLGLLALDQAQGTATANTLAKNTYATVLNRPDAWTLAGNTVHDNVVGALLIDADALVVGNGFTENTFATVLTGADGHVISNTYQDDGIAVDLAGSNAANVQANTIENAFVGVLADGGQAARIEDNRVTGGDFGAVLTEHRGASLTSNVFEGHGLLIQADAPAHARHTISASNTVNGEPIRYVDADSGGTITGPAGQVIVANSAGTTVHGVDLHNVTAGIQVIASTATRIQDTRVADAFYGVWTHRSDDTAVETTEILAEPGSGFNDALAGLLATDAPDTTLNDTRIEGPYYGAATLASNRTHVRSSTITDAAIGALVLASHDVKAQANTLGADIYNVALVGSPHGTLTQNALTNGSLFVSDDDPTSFFGPDVPQAYEQAIDPSNTVNGQPLRYVANTQDHTVRKPAGQVFVANSSHVRVNGQTIDGTTRPVYVVEADNVTISDNTLAGPVPVGAVASDTVTIDGNDLTASAWAIGAFSLAKPTIDGNQLAPLRDARYGIVALGMADLHAGANTVTGFPYGMLLAGQNTTLVSNTLVGGGLLVGPLTGHTIAPSNTVNGDPVRYLDGVDDRTVTGPAGQVLIARSENVTAHGLSFARSSVGVHVEGGANVTVEDVHTEDQPYGVVLDDVTDSTARRLTVQNASQYGIAIDDGVRSRILDSHVVGPPGPESGSLFGQSRGIYTTATSITVRSNTVEDAGVGIEAAWGGLGGNGSTVVENEVRSNTLGIDTWAAFASTDIHRNNIEGNTQAGLRTWIGAPANATVNWWGCPDGPTAPACDDVLGPALVDPWLTTPYADAGARTSHAPSSRSTELDDAPTPGQLDRRPLDHTLDRERAACDDGPALTLGLLAASDPRWPTAAVCDAAVQTSQMVTRPVTAP